MTNSSSSSSPNVSDCPLTARQITSRLTEHLRIVHSPYPIDEWELDESRRAVALYTEILRQRQS